MATTADSSSNHHSPRGSGFSGDGVHNPQFQRRNLSSLWAEVVRGDPDSIPGVQLPPTSSSLPPISVQPEQTPFFDCSPTKALATTASTNNPAVEETSDNNNGNATLLKNPVWNKPSNGVVEVAHVMGGVVSWPALSESNKGMLKSDGYFPSEGRIWKINRPAPPIKLVPTSSALYKEDPAKVDLPLREKEQVQILQHNQNRESYYGQC